MCSVGQQLESCTASAVCFPGSPKANDGGRQLWVEAHAVPGPGLLGSLRDFLGFSASLTSVGDFIQNSCAHV